MHCTPKALTELSERMAACVKQVTERLGKAAVAEGWTLAELEGHVLQPLLLGRAVKVHPLAVVLAIATGVLLAGIVGALVAVPIVAVANTVASYLTRDGAPAPDEPATGGTAVPTG